jgi:hypothetical protein
VTIAPSRHDLSTYVQPILHKQPYAFSRWGDGEWGAVLGKKSEWKKNCDGHHYYKEMAKDLSLALRLRRDMDVSNYHLGIQAMVIRMWGKAIRRWLAEYGMTDWPWHDADVFHRASCNGEFGPMFEALRKSPVVVVGPPHLRALKRVFGYNEFVEIPGRNCYRRLKLIIRNTRQAANKVSGKPVIAISASMPAEIIVHRLYETHGDRAFVIDFGSVFDPYVGVVSRKYHRGMNANDIQAVSPVKPAQVVRGSAASSRAG